MNLKKAIIEIVKTSSAPLTLLQIAKKLKIERRIEMRIAGRIPDEVCAFFCASTLCKEKMNDIRLE